MSSPTNIVVVLTHVPVFSVLEAVAKQTNGDYTTGNVVDFRHTDQALQNFFSQLSKSYNSGSQGDILTWGYCGNYVNRVDFIDAMRKFVAVLIKEFEYTRCTVFSQDQDAVATRWSMDAHGEDEDVALFSFDAEL